MNIPEFLDHFTLFSKVWSATFETGLCQALLGFESCRYCRATVTVSFLIYAILSILVCILFLELVTLLILLPLPLWLLMTILINCDVTVELFCEILCRQVHCL
jgi:hypothetical protein